MPSAAEAQAPPAAPAPTVAAPAPAPTPVAWSSPGHTHYYIDSVSGNDSNDGKSPQQAWQTLAKVNVGTFAAGDWILLKCGGHWDTVFSPSGSGENRHPIKVASYGTGPLPSVDAHAASQATVAIDNGEYWDIEDLDITNSSPTPVPFLRGVAFRLHDFGTAHGVVLRNLYVHNVASSLDKEHGGSAIFCDNHGEKVPSRFDGLLIEDCTVEHTDRNGITMDSGYTDRTRWYPNLHVIIRGNQLTDIGGDCILGIGCDGLLIEHNTVDGGRVRAKDWASGIWVWSCDNSLIQYNESSGLVGTMDAQGFDADWNSLNTLIQYNYSHDNQGGFVMVVDNGSAKEPGSAGNNGTVVRYNISQNDGFRSITCSGPIVNAQFYNNDIYVGKTDSPILIFSWNWGGGWPSNTTFTNNIFDVDGNSSFDMANMIGNVFLDNDFWGNVKLPSTVAGQLSADPLFKSPGSAGNGIQTLDGYHLLGKSPCIDAGTILASNGGCDFWGKNVPSDKSPSVGAGQR